MVSYFAHINDQSTVTDVIVTPYFADETEGQEYITNLGISGTWIETYTDGTRGKYAAIGDTYDAELDKFITPIVEE